MSTRSMWGICAVIVFLLAGQTRAQDSTAVDSAVKRWRQSVEKFEKTRTELKGPLLRQLEASETKAQNSGDTAAAEKFRAEREAFEISGYLPPSLNTNAYEKKLEAANATLTAAAKKVLATLERLDAEAAKTKLEQELEALTAKPVEPDGPVSVSPGKDPRVAWSTKGGKNLFRLHKSGEWVETIPSQPDRRHVWKEVKRTADVIELHDPVREFGMQLFAAEAKVDFDYKPTRSTNFGVWNQGGWYDPAKVDPAAEK